MQDLRELCVVICDHPTKPIWESRWLEVEGELVGDVRRFGGFGGDEKGEKDANGKGRGKGSFVVVLPYQRCRVDWDMGDCGVVLKSPGDVVG